MKPKDKAQELLNKYDWVIYSMDKYHAKKCVLILIEEQIQEANNYTSLRRFYWEKVKKEIENL